MTLYGQAVWDGVTVTPKWLMGRDCWGAYDHWRRITFDQLYDALSGRLGPGDFILLPEERVRSQSAQA